MKASASFRYIGLIIWAFCILASAVRAAPSPSSSANSPLSLSNLKDAAPTAPRAYVSPLIWIFMGLPGDEAHHRQYSETIRSWMDSFQGQFGVPEKDIAVLYGAGELKPYPDCARENLLKELKRISEAAQTTRPLWIIFAGHSNSNKAGVYFNIPGPDISAKEIGDALGRKPGDALNASARGQMLIFLTTAASGKYLKDLAAPGRVIVCASEVKEADNETEFPHALAETLTDRKSDLDGDGVLSALEIFQETKRRVEEIYQQDNLIQKEQTMLDGDGDGRATTRPADRDAQGAKRFMLQYKNSSRF
ncbi:MAG: hypothetical protein NTX50_03875 [Candidatus Sumerlaeota bacterium]|nr:hypothetical protein [Candidatus Sumerlaeota bacterium]